MTDKQYGYVGGVIGVSLVAALCFSIYVGGSLSSLVAVLIAYVGSMAWVLIGIALEKKEPSFDRFMDYLNVKQPHWDEDGVLVVAGSSQEQRVKSFHSLYQKAKSSKGYEDIVQSIDEAMGDMEEAVKESVRLVGRVTQGVQDILFDYIDKKIQEISERARELKEKKKGERTENEWAVKEKEEWLRSRVGMGGETATATATGEMGGGMYGEYMKKTKDELLKETLDGLKGRTENDK